ncbi:MAG: hypothetical protein ACTSWX_11635 [Promethearchaeota archaeon]
MNPNNSSSSISIKTENICIRCKGVRMLCGKKSCPILMKHSVLKSWVGIDPKQYKGKQDIFGASPPAVFVGHVGYPKVNIGPLLPIGEYAKSKDTAILDSPESWFGKPIEEIVGYRSGMIRTNFSVSVHYKDNIDKTYGRLNRANRKLLDATQELTLASNSVDTEAFISKIRFNLRYDINAPPTGPSGRAEEIKVVDNIKVLKPVDKVYSDRDLKAADAIFDYLYKSDEISVTSIQRLLSAGLLGVKKNRKLVPTRWSITAVDDIIGKKIAKKLIHFPTIDKTYTFAGRYLDNKFLIILTPGTWCYEMNEYWHRNSIWNQDIPGVSNNQPSIPVIATDYEFEKGRKNYASNITGAYYAARKEIEEFLFKQHRQARVIVMREISGGYLVPLGVWVIRETVRNILSEGMKGGNVQIHESLEDALQRIKVEFTLPMKFWLKTSRLIPYIRKQRRLDYWMI